MPTVGRLTHHSFVSCLLLLDQRWELKQRKGNRTAHHQALQGMFPMADKCILHGYMYAILSLLLEVKLVHGKLSYVPPSCVNAV